MTNNGTERENLEPSLTEAERQDILEQLHADQYSSGFWSEDLIKLAQDMIVNQYLTREYEGDPRLPTLSKNWGELSAESRKVYERTLWQIYRELPVPYDPLDLVCFLLRTAKERSRSRYYTCRSCLKKISPEYTAYNRLICLMPPYGDLCRYIMRETEGRVTENTNKRRSPKNMKTLLDLLHSLQPKYRAQALGLIYCGCRKTELPSLRISITMYENREVYVISIRNSKTGCRRIADKETWRHLLIDLDSQGGFFWKTILGLLGPEPFRGIKPASLESAWRRARSKLNIAGDQGWCLHSLRHDFSAELKKRCAKRERSARNKTLESALGHVSSRQSSLYGDGSKPSRIDIGVIEAFGGFTNQS